MVYLCPQSSTNAVDRPQENEAKTGSLTKKSAGTLYFSNMYSVSFILCSLLWMTLSVNRIGVSITLTYKVSIKLRSMIWSKYSNLMMPSSSKILLMSILSRLKLISVYPTMIFSFWFSSVISCSGITPTQAGITHLGQSSPE